VLRFLVKDRFCWTFANAQAAVGAFIPLDYGQIIFQNNCLEWAGLDANPAADTGYAAGLFGDFSSIFGKAYYIGCLFEGCFPDNIFWAGFNTSLAVNTFIRINFRYVIVI